PLSLSCWGCRCDRRNFGHKLWRNARTVLQNEILRVPDRAAGFIAVSAFSLELMAPHLPARKPAWVVRNPVECPSTKPAAVAGNREFLFVGRFEPEKGVGLFAEAVRRACANGARRPASPAGSARKTSAATFAAPGRSCFLHCGMRRLVSSSSRLP